MQRILVILLAAFDAVIAVAVGIAVALAPLTLLWVFGMGDPPWDALWPAAGTVWQLGHLVPLSITLPGDYLALAGIDADAASFTLSLAPLAFAAFTAVFAARSGARAARAGAWVTGVSTGTLVVAALAAAIALTSRNPAATAQLWQAVLFPTLVFALPALAGAVAAAWREGDGGLVDLVHDRIDAWPGEWDAAPGLIARGSAIALTGLAGLGALSVTVALALRGGDVIALFETGHVDALGATVLTLGQLAYLPTLIVWALAFVAGPGFALGVGTAVSPSGTQLGVVPPIPLLGAVPESSSPWLLTLVLLPVIVGGIAGWAVRGRVATPEERTDAAAAVPVQRTDAAAAVPVHPALIGLIPDRPPEPEPEREPGIAPEREAPPPPTQPIGMLATVAVGIALVSAAGAALLAFVAAGAMGPGRLAEVGPAAGPVALAVGLEILVGAGIVLLTTRRRLKRENSRASRNGAEQLDEASHADSSVVASVTGPDETALANAGRRPTAESSGSLLDDLRARVAEGPPGGADLSPDGWADSPRPAVESILEHSDDTDTAPIDLPDHELIELPDPSTLGPRRPAPLPPLD